MSDTPVSTPTDPKSDNGKAAQPARQPGEMTVSIDDADARSVYANFFRITSTPEELVIDLGLNTATFGPGHSTVKVTDRMVMNYFTAKRLLSGLTAAIQRHEQAFGVLETDVRKRARTRTA